VAIEQIVTAIKTLRRVAPHRWKVPVRAAILKAAELIDTGTLPDALIIGAQRSGTTSLHEYVTRHPGVWSARLTKEVHFFDLHWDEGSGWYRRYFPARSTRLRFRRRHGYDLAAIDASPYYLFHPDVPRRTAKVCPDVRLIALLRNPIDRALSQYKLEVRLGFEDATTFEDALEREADRLHSEEDRLLKDEHYLSLAEQHHSYVSRGHYMTQLERWLRFFPREQLLVFISEEIFSNPYVESQRLFAFLGVPERELGDLSKLSPSRSREQMSLKTRARLRAEFRESNQQLYSFLGRDVGWM
jgi:Sulfotransferase domain